MCVVDRTCKHIHMSTNLCDVLDKVLAEGQSAAYEPHGDHMVGQRHDVLVEPERSNKTHTGQTVDVLFQLYMHAGV